MGFNSAFKGLKLLKPRERAFKQFKWPRPQCVKHKGLECKEKVLYIHWNRSKTILLIGNSVCKLKLSTITVKYTISGVL